MNMRARIGPEDWGRLVLRVVLGVVFLMHGGLKLFGMGFAGTGHFMAQVGIPLSQLAAIVVMAVEFLGGAAILVGLFARWAAALLVIDMIVAILVVRLPGGFFAPRGFEFELTLLCGALALALLGSGGISLDRVLFRSRDAR